MKKDFYGTYTNSLGCIRLLPDPIRSQYLHWIEDSTQPLKDRLNTARSLERISKIDEFPKSALSWAQRFLNETLNGPFRKLNPKGLDSQSVFRFLNYRNARGTVRGMQMLLDLAFPELNAIVQPYDSGRGYFQLDQTELGDCSCLMTEEEQLNKIQIVFPSLCQTDTPELVKEAQRLMLSEVPVTCQMEFTFSDDLNSSQKPPTVSNSFFTLGESL